MWEASNRFDRIWYSRVKWPERFGQPVKVLAQTPSDIVSIEFEDGTTGTCSRYQLRRRKLTGGQKGGLSGSFLVSPSPQPSGRTTQ